MDFSDVQGLLEALGANEEPIGIYYTDTQPTAGYSPKPRRLPSTEEEARNEVDLGELFANFF